MKEGKTGIKGYTITQFENFLDAVAEKLANERADRIEENAYGVFYAIIAAFDKTFKLWEKLGELRENLTKPKAE